MSRELKCHKGIGGLVEGEALVADDNFSARYDLDRLEGVFSRKAHKLYGQSYKDKILVLNTANGGVASAWMLHEGPNGTGAAATAGQGDALGGLA